MRTITQVVSIIPVQGECYMITRDETRGPDGKLEATIDNEFRVIGWAHVKEIEISDVDLTINDIADLPLSDMFDYIRPVLEDQNGRDVDWVGEKLPDNFIEFKWK